MGAGLLIYPVLLQTLYDTYGWQGALLIIGGITFNVLVCSATFPSKQTRTKPVNRTETERGVFNIKLFCNVSYTLLCFNAIFCCMSISVIYVHLVAYAQSVGIADNKGALLVSTIGVCSFAGRFMFSALERLPWLNALTLHTLAFFLAGVATILMPHFHQYACLQVYSAIFGLLTCTIGSLVPIIIVDFLGPELMANAYGNLLLFEAVGQTIGGPLASKSFMRLPSE